MQCIITDGCTLEVLTGLVGILVLGYESVTAQLVVVTLDEDAEHVRHILHIVDSRHLGNGLDVVKHVEAALLTAIGPLGGDVLLAFGDSRGQGNVGYTSLPDGSTVAVVPVLGVPLDAHVRGNGALAQLEGHPRHHHVERLRELRAREGPRHAGGMNAVLGAEDARQAVAKVDENAVVVQGTPQTRLRLRMVVSGATFSADGAEMLLPFVRA